jgi:hypothetical protein
LGFDIVALFVECFAFFEELHLFFFLTAAGGHGSQQKGDTDQQNQSFHHVKSSCVSVRWDRLDGLVRLDRYVRLERWNCLDGNMS